MRKVKSLKGISLKKYSTIKLGDIELPIKTLSISEEAGITIKVPYDVPTKTRPATVNETEELKKTDPTYNTKTYPMIKEYDTSSKQYEQMKTDTEKYQPILEAIKYIDMDATTEEGKTMWEDLGIPRNDWFAVCRFFGEELGLSMKDYERIYIEIKALLGDSLFERLKNLSSITEDNYFTLLDKLEKLEEYEKEKEAKELAELENEDSEETAAV